VGLSKIKLESGMKDEIKEAITRQDIRDLKRENIIKLKDAVGKRKKKKRKTRRKAGSWKKKIKTKKKDYIRLTRKLRKYLTGLKAKDKINGENYRRLRKKIKSKDFRDLAHLQEFVKEIKK